MDGINRCMQRLNLGNPDSDMVDTKRGSTSDPLPLEETSDMLVAMAMTPGTMQDIEMREVQQSCILEGIILFDQLHNKALKMVCLG